MGQNAHTPTLWCVNIHGPDDVIATSDYSTAVRLANAFNSWWQAQREQRPLHENDPRMWAVPIEWPHSPTGHDEGVKFAARPDAEYAWLFAIAALAKAQPASEGE